MGTEEGEVSRVVAPPTVVIDTREGLPWTPWVWREGRRMLLPCVRRALVAGDYAIEGYEQEIAVERKSLADWIGTMFGSTTDALGERATSWERFRREVSRALDGVSPEDGSPPTPPLRRFFVLVEASRGDVEAQRYRSGVLPQSVLGRSDSLFNDRGVAVFWAHSQAIEGPRGEWLFGAARDEQNRLAMWHLCRWWERREREKGATDADVARAFRAAERSATPAAARAGGRP